MSDREDHRYQYYGRLSASGSRHAAALAAIAVLAFGACGSDGRSFSAEEFVDAANENGAHLALGEPLSTTQGDGDLYAVTIEGAVPAAPDSGAPAIPEEHGAGSLRVTESTEAAEAEYARCERAGLFCYRAANVVLVFEQDTDAEALGDLARAIRALQDQ